ncbi:MAG TPA: hypothetical protein VLN26_14870, partial [Gaiellaceae bacterium]|nr:hypothetical protein [Gaiellaceae bacterium]
MTDRAAIAAARTAAQTVETENHGLRDRLVAAKADLRRLNTELAILPGRIAELQQSAAAAHQQADAAAQTHAQLAAQLADAQKQAADADASVASLQSEIGQAQQELNELVQEAKQSGGGGGGGGGRPPIQPKLPSNGGNGDPEIEQLILEKEGEIRDLKQSLAAERARSTSAHQQISTLTPQV